MRHLLRATTLVLFLTALSIAGSGAQQPDAIPTLADSTRAPVEVLILGVFHFHNPGADYAQFESINVLAPERQREIEVVVEALERFGPRKVAVERPVAESDSLNARYRRYRNGAFMLTANEVHQLGFRLAARAGHDAVYPVDFLKGMRMDSLFTWARENDPTFIERFDDYIGKIVALMNRMQAEETIATNLRFMNEPENVRRTHEPYAVQATVAGGDTYVGARVVAGWYERNLAIFANLARIAEPGDRILFIVGAGHTPILRHLVETHPEMRLVEAVDYLP